MGGHRSSSPLIHSSEGNHRHGHRGWRIPLPVILVVVVLIYIQFFFIPAYLYQPSPSALKVSEFQLKRLNDGLRKCAEYQKPAMQYSFPIASSRTNPRWNSVSGQTGTVLIRNATLFDGEEFAEEPVDILFSRGIITSVSVSSNIDHTEENLHVVDVGGKYVTPGLIDMHSHHLVGSWPNLGATDDTNEVSPGTTGPLTPFVRSLDSMQSFDIATAIIASGGITSSLILPGSANIMGGEAFLVKNFNKGGTTGEEVVDDMLLEQGVPLSERRRFIKMACGENPRAVYSHTRMGNAWILRKHMARAQDLRDKQDEWCLLAAAAKESGDSGSIAAVAAASGDLPEELELETTVGMLRGKVSANIHCYEPEDLQDMILHSREFGFRIRAFHHAISAWKIPETLKQSGLNVTIATFSDAGFYKKEAYYTNLWAGKILAQHGIPVAYKSDHFEASTNAKYLMFEAATAHSFHLPEKLALQSVTSVPAKSLEINHRVGYVRPGYDADIVVWDSHPLLIGATPLQVYIDGKPTLDPDKVSETLPKIKSTNMNSEVKPLMRTVLSPDIKEEMCQRAGQRGENVIITGITKSFLESPNASSDEDGEMVMVLNSGRIVCFGAQRQCITSNTGSNVISLSNGYVLPGLIAMSGTLGLSEIDESPETQDGYVSGDPANMVYAKYGIHLEGKAFKRAQIGGVTRAVTSPLTHGGLLNGVSVGIKISGKKTSLDGGIFLDDVALNFVIGQGDKVSGSTSTISTAVATLRQIFADNKGNDTIYGRAADGSLPVVVQVNNKYDIMQLIKLKQDFKTVNLVIFGGTGAPAVATELAAAKIPVILAEFRDAPDQWEKLDALVGPPLTKSSAQVLSEAGVTFALAMGDDMADSKQYRLALEASWAAKYAGLSDRDAIDLVSRNIERILGLKVDEESRDFVIYEGNPLQFGASVVLTVDGDDRKIVECWPEAE